VNRTGHANLPLHGGKAPQWLFSRMKLLAREIVIHLVSEFSAEEVLRRLSDPFWFQAFGCTLGFDWHSSGVTTTVCGAVKEGIRGLERDLGLFAAGGKGATSRKTPSEIELACDRISLDAHPLVYASKTSAKVDSAAVQDGYTLYHHAFFFTKAGQWAVVQQGMHDTNGMARRYHWLSSGVGSFVEEPHNAVCCATREESLNLVALESADTRMRSAELAREKPQVILSLPRRHDVREADVNPRYLEKILLRTYETAPRDFESLLVIPGVGAKTLRALALTAELIYGAPASRRDPARYSFAHGGKDGHPYPVDRETYDKTINVMRNALNRAGIDRSEKVKAFRRLSEFASSSTS
jgi:hypothetical protein